MATIKGTLSVFASAIMLISAAGCRTLTAPSSSNPEWIPAKKIQSSDPKDTTWQDIRNQKLDNSKPLAWATCWTLLTHKSVHQASLGKCQVGTGSKIAERSGLLSSVTITGTGTRQDTKATMDYADVNYFKYGPVYK
jgi:hypothetical protein